MRSILANIAKAIPAVALIALASVIALSFLLTADSANAFETVSHNNAPPQPNPQLTAQCSNGIAVFDPANNPGLVADCAILLAARGAIIGDNGDADALDWSADIGIHRWLGVRIGRLDVNSPYRVTQLGLWREEEGLTGTIPSELGNLSSLRILSILETSLTGGIPPELGNLANLETLAIEDNRLTGIIPPELSNLANLEELRIQEIQLTGAIPPELGNLANLEILDINAELTGSIPPGLGILANLEVLSLSYNQLTGTIPPELGNLAKLERLYLQGNQLTGIIPPELGNLVNLRRLELGENQLTGCIPDSLRDLFDYADLADLGLPFCDAAPVPPAPMPTATPTSVSDATASPTSQPTRTPSPTSTSESGGDADIPNRLSALEALVQALKAMIAALDGRMAALEASSSSSAPTATRTATPTSVANVAAPTPTATFVSGIAHTATPTPDACIRRIAGIGWITGSWSSACTSERKPNVANAPAGTRYARFYTFTLDAPANVTVTLTSRDVNNTYLYLLSGIGRDGDALHENDDIDAENGNYGSRIAARLPAGSYTVEATAYNLKTAGNFTLTVDMAAAP